MRVRDARAGAKGTNADAAWKWRRIETEEKKRHTCKSVVARNTPLMAGENREVMTRKELRVGGGSVDKYKVT